MGLLSGFSASFNTQPPEGGWKWRLRKLVLKLCFNTQPPEGGWKRWQRFQHTAARRRLGLQQNQMS